MGKPLYIGIDLQVGFLSEAALASDYTLKVTNFLQTLDTEQVILTQFINQADTAFARLLGYHDMQTGDEAARLFGELESSGCEMVEKSGYTAWLPRTIEKAGALGADEIIIFGLDTDACVLKTALDIFESGLRPIVVADLCQSSAGQDRHEMGLELLRALLGEAQVTIADQLPAQTMPGRA